jgi:hypothetical protein
MGLALVVIVGVLLANNLFDRQHWAQVEESFSSIYEDRLLVESYIFKLSGELHTQKHLARDVALGEKPNNWRKDWVESECQIEELVEKFRATYFTLEEERLFSIFEQQLEELNELQLSQESVDIDLASQASERIDVLFLIPENVCIDACISLLPGLSDVQLGEGKHLNEESHALAQSSYVSSTFELAMLIILGLVFEVLLFASRSFVAKFPQRPHLN